MTSTNVSCLPTTVSRRKGPNRLIGRRQEQVANGGLGKGHLE
jgi:hypothetical protein